MRAPLSWIRDFTPLDDTVADMPAIADALNQLGLEVEAIDQPGAEIQHVVVARILDVLPHPDADRIRLADVEYGDGQLRVVCGAPNIEPGMVVPFARVGAVLPGDFRIERRKIRGVVSEGMLCSPRELGLGDDTVGSSRCPPTRRSAPTCVRSSVSTTSSSSSRSRRTARTRWVSSASRARSRPI